MVRARDKMVHVHEEILRLEGVAAFLSTVTIFSQCLISRKNDNRLARTHFYSHTDTGPPSLSDLAPREAPICACTPLAEWAPKGRIRLDQFSEGAGRDCQSSESEAAEEGIYTKGNTHLFFD